ncbi:MAG: SufD family Fe-S cluster assembly protein [Bdellovibrionales bacterium]|nr:SufD family Fe-S cluster assembly protein [Bdellovibrionales bacterium]
MSIISSYDNYLDQLKKTNLVEKWNGYISSKEQLKTRLEEYGIPKRNTESWRYTSAKFLNDLQFQFNILLESQKDEDLSSEVQKLLLKDCYHLVIVNGVFFKSLSQLPIDGLSIEAITNDNQSSKEKNFENFDQLEEKSSFSFSPALNILNQLYSIETIKITLGKGLQLNQPLQILNLTHAQDKLNVIANPTVFLELSENSKASILYSSQGSDSVKYAVNSQIRANLHEGAQLELVNETRQSFQAYHMDQILVNLSRNSTLKYLDYNISSLLSRHELVVNLNSEGSTAEVLGVSLLQKTEHCDHQTKIHFKASHTQAEQLYKNILDDQTRAVFSGTVYIDLDLFDVNSAQLNNNLLLSNTAESNSKPILMIHSDDVKATHGSTVGQLNEEELFYLQSRAISYDRAKELVSMGFLIQVIEKMENSLIKSYLKQGLVDKYLKTKSRQSVRHLE